MSEPRYSVIDGLSTAEDAANGIHSRQWLVVEVDTCTCGSPLGELPHEPGCGTEPVGRITDILSETEAMQRRIAELEGAKNAAYSERDQLVAALSKCFPSHLMLHDAEDWEDDWRSIVCINLPTGQATWHIHDSELSWVEHLSFRPQDWDGHDTPEKYRRLNALPVQDRDRAVIEAARMVVGSELLRDTAWTDALKRLENAIRLHDEARP